MKSSGYVALIEWDGRKPPMTYYHRLGYLTGKVGRHNRKADAPITRRGGNKHPSVTMQEGAIYCADEGMARAVALLAQRYGARSVNVARVMNMAPVEATEEDKEVLRRIEQVAGRVGRPPAGYSEERSYAVECFNEMVTFKISTDTPPIYCPRCGSFMCDVSGYGAHPLSMNEGEPAITLADTPRVSILYWWFVSRLRTHQGTTSLIPRIPIFDNNALPLNDTLEIYEEGVIDGDFPPRIEHLRVGALATLLLNIPDREGRQPMHLIVNSDMSFLDAFKDDPALSIDILDAIFVARWKLSRERNAHDRMVFVAEALEQHPDISIQNILMADDRVDLFDAAPRIDNLRLHAMFNAILRYDRDNNVTRDFYKME